MSDTTESFLYLVRIWTICIERKHYFPQRDAERLMRAAWNKMPECDKAAWTRAFWRFSVSRLNATAPEAPAPEKRKHGRPKGSGKKGY